MWAEGVDQVDDVNVAGGDGGIGIVAILTNPTGDGVLRGWQLVGG